MVWGEVIVRFVNSDGIVDGILFKCSVYNWDVNFFAIYTYYIEICNHKTISRTFNLKRHKKLAPFLNKFTDVIISTPWHLCDGVTWLDDYFKVSIYILYSVNILRVFVVFEKHQEHLINIFTLICYRSKRTTLCCIVRIFFFYFKFNIVIIGTQTERYELIQYYTGIYHTYAKQIYKTRKFSCISTLWVTSLTLVYPG